MGGQPRPPQRTLSGSSLSGQRPSQPQRTLSQQHLPASPARKDATASSSASSSSYVDLTGEAPDSTTARQLGTPKRAGSKLRLEVSSNSVTWPVAEVASPQSQSTPVQALPLSETTDGDHQSPALSKASQHDPDNPPMPMPKRRPRPQQLPHPASRTEPAPVPTKKDSRPKPYVVEVPAAAPRCPTANKQNRPPRDPFSKSLYSGFADFYPWKGKHNEDEWNSEGIQKGIWDRGNQSETSSARMAMYTPLKQSRLGPTSQSGLTALSTVFMTVLNQRRTKGQITAPSTFKPPPRVTLTDTKREVWMKELANPATSLRRLSRTIPHGIRGRTLLDQCMNKNVPTERAVWLTKCVGANEIRAFKRKGAGGALVVGGELKWARDWTVFVEQFVEAIASSFGEPDWKSKVTYA